MKLKSFIKVMKNQNKETLLKVATWAPIFPGFYETIFDGADREIESECELSDYEYAEYYSELVAAGVTHEFFNDHLWECTDFDNAFKEASHSICNAVLKLEHAGIIRGIDFDKLVSPKEYNFQSDSINCEITFNPKKLKKYLDENIKEFSEYIEGKYTSRDGFSSFYSNDVNDWLDVNEYGAHEVGSVLNFVILNEYNGDEREAEMDLFEESYCYDDFSNFIEIDTEKMIKDFNNKAA